jgi:phospholipase C
MRWTVEQVNAIVAGGLWPKTAIFVTWDDWGGWYDHIDPPVVETWDPARAQRPAGAFAEFAGDPFRYGSRVPCLVLGPFAKPGHISKQLNSHVSLVRFCQKNFGLPALGARDGASNGMSDCFDMTQAANPPPQ